MAGFLTTGGSMMCPHGGQVTTATSNARAKAAGSFMLRASDTFTIAGCPFLVGLVPHPCVRVQWVTPSARVRVTGDSALTQQSLGLCIAADGAPQGAVLITVAQPRVTGL